MDYIKEVALRLKGLRDALELTVEKISRECGIDPELYSKYESGEKDIPVSFLHKLATNYGVELTALMFGQEPKMSSYFVTRAGKGIKVERTKAYSYQDISAGFANRIMSTFIVTVEPKTPETEIVFNTHKGQEFNYVLQGSMEIIISGKEIRLDKGDSIMFDSALPHGMRALDNAQVKFLAIIS